MPPTARGGVVAHLHDPGAGRDQPAQGGPLGHDLRVVAGVGRGRHRRDQRVQVRRAAYPGELTGAGQLGRDRDGVGGLAAAVEVEDAVVDELVRGTVEVGGPQHLDDVGDRVLGQHHRAEHRLLGLDGLRRRAVVLGWPGRSGRPDARVVRQNHAVPSRSYWSLTCSTSMSTGMVRHFRRRGLDAASCAASDRADALRWRCGAWQSGLCTPLWTNLWDVCRRPGDGVGGRALWMNKLRPERYDPATCGGVRRPRPVEEKFSVQTGAGQTDSGTGTAPRRRGAARRLRGASPMVLMWPGSWIRFLSSSGPPASLTAFADVGRR